MANVVPKVDALIKDITVLSETVASLVEMVKLLTDTQDKALKNLMKMSKDMKKSSSTTKKAASGFVKPISVSPELAKFLEIDPDEKISRVDATKKITKYIKDKKLQDPSNGRIIHLDDTLKKFLKPVDGVGADGNVTWFTLQKLLKDHLLK